MNMNNLFLYSFTAFLAGLTYWMVWRLKNHKPINNPTEIIFVVGIALGGILMWFGLREVGTGNLKETLSLVVAHLSDAILVNVAAMFCKLAYLICEGKQIAKDGSLQVDSDTQHLISQLSKVLIDNQTKTDANMDKLDKTLLSNQERSDAKLDQLSKALTDFSTNLSKEFVEKLGSALQSLISNLEQKITENLGDSFRSLGVAVEELVKWQAQYKEDLVVLMASHQEILKTLEANAKSFDTLANKSQVFSDVANNMNGVTEQIRGEMDKLVSLAGSLESSLKELATVPGAATDKMNEYIKTLKDGADGQKTILERTGAQLEGFSDRLENSLIKQMNRIEGSFDTSTKAFHDAIDKSNRDYANGLNKFFADFRKEIDEVNGKFRTDLSSFHNEINQKISEQVTKMGATIAAVREETAKSLDTAMREFSVRLTDILVHSVKTSKDAYGIATNTKDAFEQATRKQAESRS